MDAWNWTVASEYAVALVLFEKTYSIIKHHSYGLNQKGRLPSVCFNTFFRGFKTIHPSRAATNNCFHFALIPELY